MRTHARYAPPDQADGTTTARSPDGTKTLHSHGPPARAG